MTTGTLRIDGTEAIVTPDGWRSDDLDLAASLNRGWPVGGGAVGDPVVRAFRLVAALPEVQVISEPIPTPLPADVVA